MYSVESPLRTTPDRLNLACAPKTLPVRRWQARQWQIETRTGSSRVVNVNWPQLQEAVLVFIRHFNRRVAAQATGQPARGKRRSP
jgi:hypothetical protein